jgi:hypothetical protein
VSASGLAAVMGLVFVAACAGTEELALNPMPSTSSAGAGGAAMMPAGGSSSGTTVGGAGVGMTGGMASDSGQAGTISQAGQRPNACSADVECATPTPRCSESGSCVACLSDDDCPLDGARRCSEQAGCVACLDNEDCGDSKVCETLTGACQTCPTADCAGTAGASSDDAKP